MAIDPAILEKKLRARLGELALEDETAAPATEAVTLDQEAVGRLSRMDALQGQAMALATRERRRAERRRIEAALARLPTDAFGWCEGCGEAIAEARLLNDPTVTHCIRCAR